MHKYYNALNNIHLADYRVLKKLKEKFGSWERAFKNDPKASSLDIETSFLELTKNNIKIILKEDKEYPPLLKESSSAPHALYVKGVNPDIYGLGTIAIVGTRKSTKFGEDVARNWAEDFARKGLVVVSGLALGIDAAAHSGACRALGKTIAVLGCGLKSIYPAENENLAKKIIELGGSIISEYPFSFPSLPKNFIERNRIVAALSLGTLVIEAPEKSGALITASMALDENREVMVIPGAIGHINFVGSNKLIQAGARLVSSSGEVLETLGLKIELSGDKKSLETIRASVGVDNIDHLKIIEVLQKAGKPLIIDEIIELTNIDSKNTSAILTILLLRDIIIEEKGKYEIRYS